MRKSITTPYAALILRRSLAPKEKVHVKSDERILGDGAFVKRFLAESQDRYEFRYALQANGINLDHAAARAAELLGIQSEQVRPVKPAFR